MISCHIPSSPAINPIKICSHGGSSTVNINGMFSEKKSEKSRPCRIFPICKLSTVFYYKLYIMNQFFFTTVFLSADGSNSWYFLTSSIYAKSFLFLSKYSLLLTSHKHVKLRYISINSLKNPRGVCLGALSVIICQKKKKTH